MRNILTFVLLAATCFCTPMAVTSVAAGEVVWQEDQQAGETEAADTNAEWERLRQRFRTASRALRNTRQIDDRDRALLERMYQEIQQLLDNNPEHAGALAMAAQMAIWLEKPEEVDQHFSRLVELRPDDTNVAQAWMNHVRREEGPDSPKLDQLYQQMMQQNPDDIGLRQQWAETLIRRTDYDRAIDALTEIDIRPEDHPRAFLTLSEAYFNSNRFQEALEALNRIPETVAQSDPSVMGRAQRDRRVREEYVELWQQEQELRSAEAAADDLPRAEIETSKGTIVVELFEDHAPNTVANFIKLAEEDFYNGTTFHRVEPNFMIQGGDPLTTLDDPDVRPGTGNPGYYIPDEHGPDQDDDRMHFAGSLAMAKQTPPNTGGSQFYITHRPTDHLNHRHTVFGRVLEGMDVVYEIEQDDEIIDLRIVRKRDHEYEPETLPAPNPTQLPSRDTTGRLPDTPDDAEAETPPAGSESDDAPTPSPEDDPPAEPDDDPADG